MPAAGRFIAKMASHWTWKLCQWPWNVKSTLRKAGSSTTQTWIALKKTSRYLELRSFTFLDYMISTRNYLRPCMYKRHKPGMYKRHKPGMYKRQFARSRPVIGHGSSRIIMGSFSEHSLGFSKCHSNHSESWSRDTQKLILAWSSDPAKTQ